VIVDRSYPINDARNTARSDSHINQHLDSECRWRTKRYSFRCIINEERFLCHM